MELRGTGTQGGQRETLDGAVVERRVRDPVVVGGGDGKAVVLRRHQHTARTVLEHRVVRTAVTEGKLVRRPSDCACNQLVAEAHAEDVGATEQLADHRNLVLERRRIARAR